MLVPCSSSHAAEKRRQKRKQEMKLDAADQEAEEAERAAARQRREEEAQLRADGELLQLLQCLWLILGMCFYFAVCCDPKCADTHKQLPHSAVACHMLHLFCSSWQEFWP